MLRNIDYPWYIRNSNLHRDLAVNIVKDTIKKAAKRHKQRLHNHDDITEIQKLDTKEDKTIVISCVSAQVPSLVLTSNNHTIDQTTIFTNMKPS